MSPLRLHITRVFTFIVALQIMNMGFFVQDFRPLTTSPYEINIINTVVEYVAEVVLNHTNAIPESNDHQKKDVQNHKHIDYKIINIYRTSLAFSAKPVSALKCAVYLHSYNYQFWEDITPPPPKNVV